EVSGVLPTDAAKARRSELNAAEAGAASAAMSRRFAYELPPADLFAWGISAGRVGVLSLIAVGLAGLHLSYRNILRPRSVVMFVAAFGVGTMAVMFTPGTFQRVGPWVLWDFVKHFPGETMTLFNYLFTGSDVIFAGVFILALPGTEPLTPRGRRVFLAAAGLVAAWAHREWPGVPAASVCLTGMMPLARVFDWVFKHRSWLR
ncbi:MAG TPA: RnfABCDGE type electron transport complex subunit D, partial [Phycisphaerae bacterium]|nr:RnfABCDGE type electron transport complex subunit D [Phycisphaerae bacterium]